MKIGVPKEIKPQENRIGLTPSSVKILTSNGHEVLVETKQDMKLVLKMQIKEEKKRALAAVVSLDDSGEDQDKPSTREERQFLQQCKNKFVPCSLSSWFSVPVAFPQMLSLDNRN